VKSTSPVIRKHKNTIGRDCEASGEPFRIALTDHLRPPTGTA
jgi:hypothetical protein